MRAGTSTSIEEGYRYTLGKRSEGGGGDDMGSLEEQLAASGATAPLIMLLDLKRVLAEATEASNDILAARSERMRMHTQWKEVPGRGFGTGAAALNPKP